VIRLENRRALGQPFSRLYEAVRKVAKKSPEAFVAIAARICPDDVRLSLEQAILG
jgi:hypothetical protein